MKILHAVEFYAPSVGGMQEVVRQLSERMAAHGHDVTVVTTNVPERSFSVLNGVKVVGFNIKGNLANGLNGEVDRYRAYLLENQFDAINGLVHCSGGGQTKCLKFVPDNVRIVKDNLFEPPIIFKLIQEASKSGDREMYQVFNMGTRLEIYTNEKDVESIISVSKNFGVDAQVIGRVEESEKKKLIVL